jgi:hypothetical protein
MRTVLLAACLLCSACTTGLERDGRCLAALTPDFLNAHTELTRLQTFWRALPYRMVRGDPAEEVGMARAGEDRLRGSQAELRAAVTRYQTTLDWYDRIYQRVRTRIEERQMLTEAFWTLATGPGLIFYPFVHWNVHRVMWDGTDPDAESDPVRQYCHALASTGLDDPAPAPQ